MGHATLTNISKIASQMLRAPNGTRIADIVDELDRRKQAVHASEGLYRERYMLSNACEQYVGFLLEKGLIAPAKASSRERRLITEWTNGAITHWDCGDDGKGGEYDQFDRIRFSTNRKSLPLLHHVTN